MAELMNAAQLKQQGQGEEPKAVSSLKVQSAGVPAGSYTGPLVGIWEQDEDAVRGYGPGIKWVFEVDKDCPHKGAKASRITPAKLTEKNATGKFLANLLGGELPGNGADVDLAQLVGRRFMFVVSKTESGGTRVEVASPI